MSFAFKFIFIVFAVISTFIQTEENPKRKFYSPAITAISAAAILVGGLTGSAPPRISLILFAALLMLAMSDMLFELSLEKPNLFALAMVFGVLSGFTIAILFNVTAHAAGAPLWVLGIFAVVGIGLLSVVYSFLDVDPGLKIPVYIYLIQAVFLFTGGMSSLYVGNIFFAIWGVFIFISDSLVGIRAFPNAKKPIPWLDKRRLLLYILVLYYPAQFALISWAQ
ncbi:MAG TPA: hypothetical protein VJ965_02310 [Anaerolineales bacterium]|nr:hypothetical protein [Anaerolineales bacterium]